MRDPMSTPQVLLVAFLALLLIGGAFAATAVVTMKDGRVIEGEFVEETEDELVLRIAGIRTAVPRDEISKYEVKPGVEEEYARRRAELKDDDISGRYELALFLFNERAYELARKELVDLSKRAPDNENIERLLTVVETRIKLMEEEQPNEGDNRPPRPNPNTTQTQNPNEEEYERLTQEQINLIKVYNVRLDEKPKVVIPREVIDEMLSKYSSEDIVPKAPGDIAAFRRLPGYEQLALFFELRAGEFYSKIEVRGTPSPIQDFRTKLHRQYVVNYCATNQCHGGAGGGSFYLFNKPPNEDTTVYTNFYILEQYENEDGEMLDRHRPQRSLLLQYGLSADAASTGHPEVPGWRPQFVSEKDRRFLQYVDAIRDLGQRGYDYGIDYQPPRQKKPQAGETGPEQPATNGAAPS